MKQRKNILIFYFHFLIKAPALFVSVFIINILTYPVSLVAVPYLAKIFVDRATNCTHALEPLPILILLVMAVAFYSIFDGIGDVLTAKIVSRASHDIRIHLYSYIQGQSYSYLLNTPTGVISQRLNRVTDSVKEIIFWISEILIPFALSMIITIALVFRTSKIFALIFFSWFLVSFSLAYFLKRTPLKHASSFEKSSASFSGEVVDSLKNFVNIKTFNMEDREKRYLLSKSSKLADIHGTLKSSGAKVRLSLNVVDVIFLILLCFTLILFYTKGTLTIGGFVFIFSLYTSFKNSVEWIGSNISNIFERISTADRSLNFLLRDRKEKLKGAKKLKTKKGEIEFKDVYFRYGKREVLSSLNLKISPNEKVGIVGLSGSGKSSLVKLLLGFYDFRGDILIDGQSIKEATLGSLRENISYIPQEPTIFKRSLRYNLTCSNPKATKEEIDKAAKLAGIYPFIKRIPKGYRAIVGEGSFSGGQKQRVAIARALLKNNSKILLMDEATSALDTKTEQFIKRSMKKFLKDKTAIVIAHRLTTLKEMDRIVVVEKGRVVESGTHEELLLKNGPYSKLWNIHRGDILSR